MIIVEEKQAKADRMSHVFRPGMGFVQIGKPLMPTKPIFAASLAEPPAPVSDGSLHFLNPPNGASPMPLIWHVGPREWSPKIPSAGKRIGFTSAYLAAHGWFYLGPAPVEMEA